MKCYRSKKRENFTSYFNSFIRDPNLSGNAKTVMSVILSLPDDWNLTIKGLEPFVKEKKDAISSAFRELEAAGFIERHKIRNKDGRYGAMEYIVYESGKNAALENHDKGASGCSSAEHRKEGPISCNGDAQTSVEEKTNSPPVGQPEPDSPEPVFPVSVLPESVFPSQTNTVITNTVLNKSYPILSPRTDTPSVPGSFSTDMIGLDTKYDRTEESVDYRELAETVKEQINYEYLLDAERIDKDFLDTVVALMTEVFLSKEHETLIGCESRPMEYVKERFLQLESDHIEYVFDRMNATETKIQNIRQYLRAALFNATATMGTYYYRRVHEDGVVG